MKKQDSSALFGVIGLGRFGSALARTLAEAGKEVIARYVHQNSQRNKKIFLPVNCAAIPHELMESEFFGYEKR